METNELKMGKLNYNDDVFTVRIFPPKKGIQPSNIAEASYGRKVGITRMSRAELNSELLNSSDIIPLEKRDLYNLNDEVTGEIRIFRFYLDSEAPAFHVECLKSFLKDFEATNAGNILRITTCPGEQLSPGELRELRYYLENEDGFKIAIGEDPTLPSGSISALIVSYFTEEFTYYEWAEACENGCIEDVIEAEMLMKHRIHKDLDESQWDIDYDFNINDVFRDIIYKKNRTWRQTEEVLDFLIKKGARINGLDLALHFWGAKGKDVMEFNLELLKWGMRKGIDINQVVGAETCLDHLEQILKKADIDDKPFITEAIHFLKSNGGLTCEEIRSNEYTITPSYNDEIRKIRCINSCNC